MEAAVPQRLPDRGSDLGQEPHQSCWSPPVVAESCSDALAREGKLRPEPREFKLALVLVREEAEGSVIFSVCLEITAQGGFTERIARVCPAHVHEKTVYMRSSVDLWNMSKCWVLGEKCERQPGERNEV